MQACPFAAPVAAAPARRADAAGFTLIELMVVIVILGVLAGLVLPRIVDQPDKARVVKARMQIESLSMALKQYKLDNGFYPSTEQGLRSLKEKPSIGRVPQNYPAKGYVDALPKDPWGRDFVYICPGEHGDFDIISLGANREEGGEGVDADIKSWDIGG
ncbi:MAG: type II secretion system major pseudopilin GspG [Solidesulfovibrio sp. DCME]|uniref:type II secretion system major pseudopilin GspG n=1 Tax=Solidesulfovibrio sp. DCME TaxID=3447380 RepID=UPI003D09F994